MPLSAKCRRAVTCASTRFSQDEFAGVSAILVLFAAARAPARAALAVVKRSAKLPQTIAIGIWGGQRVRW